MVKPQLHLKEITFTVRDFLRDGTVISYVRHENSVFYSPPEGLLPVFNILQNMLHLTVTCRHI